MRKVFIITILIGVLSLAAAREGFSFTMTELPDGNAIIVSPFGEFQEGGAFTMYLDASSMNVSAAYIDTSGNPTGYAFMDYLYASTIRRKLIYKVFRSRDGRNWEYWDTVEIGY